MVFFWGGGRLGFETRYLSQVKLPAFSLFGPKSTTWHVCSLSTQPSFLHCDRYESNSAAFSPSLWRELEASSTNHCTS